MAGRNPRHFFTLGVAFFKTAVLSLAACRASDRRCGQAAEVPTLFTAETEIPAARGEGFGREGTMNGSNFPQMNTDTHQ